VVVSEGVASCGRSTVSSALTAAATAVRQGHEVKESAHGSAVVLPCDHTTQVMLVVAWCSTITVTKVACPGTSRHHMRLLIT
jgi:hypothetical protein